MTKRKCHKKKESTTSTTSTTTTTLSPPEIITSQPPFANNQPQPQPQPNHHPTTTTQQPSPRTLRLLRLLISPTASLYDHDPNPRAVTAALVAELKDGGGGDINKNESIKTMILWDVLGRLYSCLIHDDDDNNNNYDDDNDDDDNGQRYYRSKIQRGNAAVLAMAMGEVAKLVPEDDRVWFLEEGGESNNHNDHDDNNGSNNECDDNNNDDERGSLWLRVEDFLPPENNNTNITRKKKKNETLGDNINISINNNKGIHDNWDALNTVVKGGRRLLSSNVSRYDIRRRRRNWNNKKRRRDGNSVFVNQNEDEVSSWCDDDEYNDDEYDDDDKDQENWRDRTRRQRIMLARQLGLGGVLSSPVVIGNTGLSKNNKKTIKSTTSTKGTSTATATATATATTKIATAVAATITIVDPTKKENTKGKTWMDTFVNDDDFNIQHSQHSQHSQQQQQQQESSLLTARERNIYRLRKKREKQQHGKNNNNGPEDNYHNNKSNQQHGTVVDDNDVDIDVNDPVDPAVRSRLLRALGGVVPIIVPSLLHTTLSKTTKPSLLVSSSSSLVVTSSLDPSLVVSSLDQASKSSIPNSSPSSTSCHRGAQSILATDLLCHSFHPHWRVRHGALLGLLSIFRAWSSSSSTTTIRNNSASSSTTKSKSSSWGKWPEDVIVRCVCILALDRFADYSGAGVTSQSNNDNNNNNNSNNHNKDKSKLLLYEGSSAVAPVREAAGQMLALLLPQAPLNVQIGTRNVLEKLSCWGCGGGSDEDGDGDNRGSTNDIYNSSNNDNNDKSYDKIIATTSTSVVVGNDDWEIRHGSVIGLGYVTAMRWNYCFSSLSLLEEEEVGSITTTTTKTKTKTKTNHHYPGSCWNDVPARIAIPRLYDDSHEVKGAAARMISACLWAAVSSSSSSSTAAAFPTSKLANMTPGRKAMIMEVVQLCSPVLISNLATTSIQMSSTSPLSSSSSSLLLSSAAQTLSCSFHNNTSSSLSTSSSPPPCISDIFDLLSDVVDVDPEPLLLSLRSSRNYCCSNTNNGNDKKYSGGEKVSLAPAAGELMDAILAHVNADAPSVRLSCLRCAERVARPIAISSLRSNRETAATETTTKRMEMMMAVRKEGINNNNNGTTTMEINNFGSNGGNESVARAYCNVLMKLFDSFFNDDDDDDDDDDGNGDDGDRTNDDNGDSGELPDDNGNDTLFSNLDGRTQNRRQSLSRRIRSSNLSSSTTTVATAIRFARDRAWTAVAGALPLVLLPPRKIREKVLLLSSSSTTSFQHPSSPLLPLLRVSYQSLSRMILHLIDVHCIPRSSVVSAIPIPRHKSSNFPKNNNDDEEKSRCFVRLRRASFALAGLCTSRPNMEYRRQDNDNDDDWDDSGDDETMVKEDMTLPILLAVSCLTLITSKRPVTIEAGCILLQCLADVSTSSVGAATATATELVEGPDHDGGSEGKSCCGVEVSRISRVLEACQPMLFTALTELGSGSVSGSKSQSVDVMAEGADDDPCIVQLRKRILTGDLMRLICDGDRSGDDVGITVREFLGRINMTPASSSTSSSCGDGGTMTALTSMRVRATLSGAVVAMASVPKDGDRLPPKLTPLVRSLMTSTMNETSTPRIQYTSCSLVHLVRLLSQPGSDGIVIGPYKRSREKIINKISSLASSSVDNSLRESIFVEPTTTKVIPKARASSKIVGRLVSAIPLEKTIKEYFPSMWYQLEILFNIIDDKSVSIMSDDSANRIRLAQSLRLFGIISRSLLKDTAAFQAALLLLPPAVHVSCSGPDVYFKEEATYAITNMCLTNAMVSLPSILPVVLDHLRQPSRRNDDFTRLGACVLLNSLVLSLGVKICPFVRLLLPVAMSMMIDSLAEISFLSATTFARLVQIAPLVGESSFVKDADLLNEGTSDKVIDHLIIGKPLPPCILPDQITRMLNTSGIHLRQYQKEGISWIRFLHSVNLNGALCDEMGLGKTLQTLVGIGISHLNSNNLNPKSLVICPSSVVGHWMNEISRIFFDCKLLRATQYTGPSKKRRLGWNKSLENFNIFVTSYSILRSDIILFQNISWDYCVLDEGHLLKNPKTATAKAARRLRSRHKLILTGTPVQNRVHELWATFDFLMPNYLGSEKDFMDRYAAPILVGQSGATPKKVRIGLNKLKLLHQKVLPFILRREKDQVLRELPPKIITDIPCSLSEEQIQLYKQFCHEEGAKRAVAFLQTSLDSKNSERLPSSIDNKDYKSYDVLKSLIKLRMICTHPCLVQAQNKYTTLENVEIEKDDMNNAFGRIGSSGKLLALNDLLRSSQIYHDELTAADNDHSLIYVREQDTAYSNDVQDFEEISNTFENVLSQQEDSKINGSSKCLIFAQFIQSLDVVENLLFQPHMPSLRYLRLDGRVPPHERTKIVNQFNCDTSIKCMLLTTKVGGLGLNLQAADVVIFLENDWNPQADLQAMDRAHRIGQKKTVNVYRLITTNTIEEKIMKLQEAKITMSNAIVNSENSTMFSMGTNRLLDLFTLGEKSDTRLESIEDLDTWPEEYLQLSVKAFLEDPLECT